MRGRLAASGRAVVAGRLGGMLGWELGLCALLMLLQEKGVGSSLLQVDFFLNIKNLFLFHGR